MNGNTVAIYFNDLVIYWSSILIFCGALAFITMTLALWKPKNPRSAALGFFFPLAILLSFFLSRFLHWYFNMEQYSSSFGAGAFSSFSAAFTRFSIGSYCLPGVILGIWLAAWIVSLLGFCTSAGRLLDFTAPGACLLIALMEMLSALVLRLTDASLIYLLPFAWIPILARMFYDSRTAYFAHLTTIMLVSLSVPDPFLFLLLQLPTGMVAVVSLKDLTRRSQLAFTAIYILLTYAFVYTLYNLMLTGDASRLDPHLYLYFALNGLLVITVYSLVYLFEKMFRLVSSLTLVELSNINSDLMQTFAEQAPGTFQHSLQVSNLASEAAKSINADALLMRTAALYHDIGKLAHPGWFIENQNGGDNPLLAMSNRDAAKAVIAHVEEGDRFAREHRLPDVVRMFIRTHHGTSLVRYF